VLNQLSFFGEQISLLLLVEKGVKRLFSLFTCLQREFMKRFRPQGIAEVAIGCGVALAPNHCEGCVSSSQASSKAPNRHSGKLEGKSS
jgi:hypothetical protein